MSEVKLYGDGIGFVRVVQSMGTDLMAINAARVSYAGNEAVEWTEREDKLLSFLVKNRHTSPFEHLSITFHLKVPLFVRSQHMRHRTWSYNEISRRYTDHNIEFYTPNSFRAQAKTNRQASDHNSSINPVITRPTYDFVTEDECYANFTASSLYNKACRDSLALFNELIAAGVCREQARGILPQTTYTEYYATVNAHNLNHFVNLRDHGAAQGEIVELARGMSKLAAEVWPRVWSVMEQNRAHVG